MQPNLLLEGRKKPERVKFLKSISNNTMIFVKKHYKGFKLISKKKIKYISKFLPKLLGTLTKYQKKDYKIKIENKICQKWLQKSKIQIRN